uniref:Uncharacterized protein n=1 Tax=Anopheles atroparvus TaxID=41427 RepID=A0A182ILQ5_ANOAO
MYNPKSSFLVLIRDGFRLLKQGRLGVQLLVPLEQQLQHLLRLGEGAVGVQEHVNERALQFAVVRREGIDQPGQGGRLDEPHANGFPLQGQKQRRELLPPSPIAVVAPVDSLELAVSFDDRWGSPGGPWRECGVAVDPSPTVPSVALDAAAVAALPALLRICWTRFDGLHLGWPYVATIAPLPPGYGIVSFRHWRSDNSVPSWAAL